MPKNIFNLLSKDLTYIAKYKSSNSTTFSYVKAVLSLSFVCISFYRISHFLHQIKVPLIPRLIWWFNFILFKVDLD